MSKNLCLLQTYAGVSVEWQIKEFFSLPETTGYKLESPMFKLSDTKWSLQIFPNGDDRQVGWVSLYLRRESSPSVTHNLECTLGVRKSDGSELKSFTEKYISKKNEGFGFPLVERAKLYIWRHSVLSEAGFLTVYCKVRDTSTDVIRQNLVHTSSQTSSQESIEVLQQNFKELYASGREADVTFKVRGQELLAHSLILSSRSPVFFEMFQYGTVDEKTSIVHIDDCDAETFFNLLSFIYSGNLNVVSSSNSVSLYKAADKYNLTDMKNECLRQMTEELSMEIFCDVLLLATMYKECELLETITDFFTQNMANILQSSDWQLLGRANFSAVNELLIRLANKKYK